VFKRVNGALKNAKISQRRTMTTQTAPTCVSAEVIQKLLSFIETNGGMQKEGIFRVSGNALKVTSLHRTCVQNG
jgi:hypothetical protein